MNELMNSCLAGLNDVGRAFCSFSANMFVQSGVLIILLLVIDLLMRKRLRATFRYWIWMLVFVKLILPPSLSMPTGIGYWIGDRLSAAAPVLERLPIAEQQESAGVAASEYPELSADIPLALPSRTNPEPDAPVTPAAPTVAARPTWQAIAFLLWLAGVSVISIFLIRRIKFVRGLIAQSTSADDRSLDMLNQCRREVGVRRNVQLRLSTGTPSPAVCGLFKPTILIPAALPQKLSPDKLRAVLIHELAHIRRGDLWINSAQTVLQIIYFYNPLIWLANAAVRRIREQAVDEMVLVALGIEAKSYGSTLIDIAEMAFLKTSLSLHLIGVVESKKALHGRIRHMLNRPIPKSTKLSVVGVFAIIVAGIVLLPMAKGERKLRNPVRLDKNDRSIITHTLYIWGQVENPVYQLEGKIYREVDKVVARIGELMKQDPFPMIRVRTTSQFQRQQEPIENFGKRCRDIDFINIEYKYDLSISTGTFQAIFPNDVTVELVAVCEHPSRGKQWWRPDGTPMDTHQFRDYDYDDAVTVKEDEYARLLALKFDDDVVQDVQISWSLENTRESRFAPDYSDRKRRIRRPVQVILAAFPDATESADLRLGVAAGPWKTVASGALARGGAHTLDSIGQRDVIYHKSSEENGRVHISATHLLGSDYDCRIYARGKNGEVYEPRKYSNGGREMRHCKSEFEIPLEKIKMFHLQARPFRWVTFKNISLQPGLKTDVQVMLEDDRVVLLNDLKSLALAVILYASDHNGSLAEKLEEIKDYLNDERLFEWALENVEYLGNGAKLPDAMSTRTTQPLAYYKKPLGKENGTAVVFLDGHAEFINGPRLQELGITYSQ